MVNLLSFSQLSIIYNQPPARLIFDHSSLLLQYEARAQLVHSVSTYNLSFGYFSLRLLLHWTSFNLAPPGLSHNGMSFLLSCILNLPEPAVPFPHHKFTPFTFAHSVMTL
jgi:hypothetical protein